MTDPITDTLLIAAGTAVVFWVDDCRVVLQGRQAIRSFGPLRRWGPVHRDSIYIAGRYSDVDGRVFFPKGVWVAVVGLDQRRGCICLRHQLWQTQVI